MDEFETGPASLPVPSRSSHRSVEVGACVMEYAALLGGEAHSDHPARVHPLLADLCRRTNDRLGDDTRAGLVRLVPALIGTAQPLGPDGDPGVVSRAIADVYRRHLERRGAPVPPPPRSALADRLDPGAGGGTAVLDRPVAVEPARERYLWIDRAFEWSWSHRRDDDEVAGLLEEMVLEVRAAQGLPPVPTSGPMIRPA